jgi:hypothetical protein
MISIDLPDSPPEISDIYERFNDLKPVARKISVLLGIADPELRRFVEAPLASTILGERLAYQLPPERGENSFKFYPMIGYVARLVCDEYKALCENNDVFESAKRGFNSEMIISDKDKEDAALLLALRKVFSNTVLVGPTTGSFGIGLLKMAEALRGLKLGGHDLFDAHHTVTGIALFPPDPVAEMPKEKWQTIKRLHTEQNNASNAKTLEAEPYRYKDRSSRDADALTLLIQDFQGNGFYTPTNPLSLNEVADLAKIIVGNTERVSELTPVQRRLLADFFIDINEDRSTLTITRPFGGGVAGSAQSLFDAETYFEDSGVNVSVAFPTSAGPGAGGLALSSFCMELTPDPASPYWASFLEQNRFYTQPVALDDQGEQKVSAANGMGSTLKPENIVALLVEDRKEGSIQLTETTDVLRRIARALLHCDLTVGAALDGGEGLPYPELAAATSLAAQLEKKLRQASKEEGGVENFADRVATCLKAVGITANDFWQYASRGAPHQDASSIPADLKTLADIQGERSDNGTNFLSLFIKTLVEKLDAPRDDQPHGLPKSFSDPQERGAVKILQITGFNAEPDLGHSTLKRHVQESLYAGYFISSAVPSR